MWPKKKENGEENGRPPEVQRAIDTMPDEDFDDIAEQMEIKKKLKGKP